MENEIIEEIYRCSKCGLCKSVCPIYIATKNEMYLPRGRYILLNNFFNNKKKLNKEFIKNIDICLNCNLCKNFCPSNIDSYKIFTKLKYEYNYKSGIFNFSCKYKIFLNILRIFSCLYKIFPFKNILKNTFFYSMYNVRVKRKKSDKQACTKGKIIFFEGCYNHYINASDKNAAINILESLGYEVILPKFNCCGYSYLSDGEVKLFIKNAKKFFNNLNCDYKYVVCTCDSCFDSLNRMKYYNCGNDEFFSKLIRLDELLKIENYPIPDTKNYVYHMPLIRNKNCFIFDSSKMLNRKGICSLMENFFYIKHKKESDKISKVSFYNEKEINNKTIVTSCQISKWGLKSILNNLKLKFKVLSLAEFIELERK